MTEEKDDRLLQKQIVSFFDGRLLISHSECAKILRIHSATLYRLGNVGKIGFVKDGSKRGRRYRASDVYDYLHNDQSSQPAKADQELTAADKNRINEIARKAVNKTK